MSDPRTAACFCSPAQRRGVTRQVYSETVCVCVCVCVCVRVRQTFSYFNLWKHETTEDLINVETHTGTIASTAHRKLELCSLSSGWQADFITNLLMKEQ